jgi:hypothetical protein
MISLSRGVGTRRTNSPDGFAVPHSLFVCVPGATREQAFKVGREIAEAVTKANPWYDSQDL